MQNITTAADLKNAIHELEFRQAAEFILLKEQFLITAESLKPINIIRSAIRESVLVPDLKKDLINAAIGVGTGVVAKKILLGNTHNPLKKLLGVILEIVVANKVSKDADGIKYIGSNILKRIFGQKTVHENHNDHSP